MACEIETRLGWRRLCTRFKGTSGDLCASLASVARRICSSYVNPALVAPLLACRLIALDKHSGIRPIGVGNSSTNHFQSSVGHCWTRYSGCFGLPAVVWGQIAGIEAAVHATRAAFGSEESQAALLVDATNAFNTLNRQVALHNIRRLCPPIATILINSYRRPTELFMDGDGRVRSTQTLVIHQWAGPSVIAELAPDSTPDRAE